eukprot:scaffold754_cov248-Pinguiococcus_pyrenoidosus.AAC.50
MRETDIAPGRDSMPIAALSPSARVGAAAIAILQGYSPEALHSPARPRPHSSCSLLILPRGNGTGSRAGFSEIESALQDCVRRIAPCHEHALT